MAYTELGIINLALARMGVEKLTAAQWATPTTVQAAIDAYAVWEYIRDEVMEALDWAFVKTRASLERAVVDPAYGYDYQYILPADFLRLSKGLSLVDPSVYPVGISPYTLPMGADREFASSLSKYMWKIETVPLETGVEKVTNGTFTGAATGWTLGTNWVYSSNNVVRTAHTDITTLSQLYSSMVSAPVVGELYAVEFDIDAISGGALLPSYGGVTGDPVASLGVKKQFMLASSITTGLAFTPTTIGFTCTIDSVSIFKVEDRKVLLTDYQDDADNPLYITYTRRVTDVSRYSAQFINALAWRLAQELSTTRTEGANKFQFCKGMYDTALREAAALSSHADYIEEEGGSTSWEDAGR